MWSHTIHAENVSKLRVVEPRVPGKQTTIPVPVVQRQAQRRYVV